MRDINLRDINFTPGSLINHNTNNVTPIHAVCWAVKGALHAVI